MNIIIRPSTLSDLDEIVKVEDLSWPEGLRADEDKYRSRIKTFCEGVICAETVNGIQGVVSTEIVNYDLLNPISTWNEITDRGYITSTHNPTGNTLYGVSLSVSPYAGIGVAKKLLNAAGELAIKKNLKRVVFGARIPGYRKYHQSMSAYEYVHQRTRRNRPIDPELAFYESVVVHGNKLYLVTILCNYFTDPDSHNFGVLLAWDNPQYKDNMQRGE